MSLIENDKYLHQLFNNIEYYIEKAEKSDNDKEKAGYCDRAQMLVNESLKTVCTTIEDNDLRKKYEAFVDIVKRPNFNFNDNLEALLSAFSNGNTLIGANSK